MDQPKRPRSAIVIPLLITVAALVSGCGGTAAASVAPSQAAASPSDSAVPSEAPSADPGAGATSPAPDPSGLPAGRPDDAPTACLTVGEVDCERARSFAASTLTVGDPPVRYVQVGPFGCATGDLCPLTLVARPEGDVVIEFTDAQAINVHLKVAPDGTFEATREAGMGIAVEPTSAEGVAGDPMDFTLGHCGVFSGIDVDGAWWDPVGNVAMDSGEAVNATAGVLTFLDEDAATFATPAGFSLHLIRHDGPKFLPFCQ
jgi:hypothetical protein